MLEGTLEVEADGQRYRLGPDDFLSLRPGVLPALHNPGPGWNRALTLVSPEESRALEALQRSFGSELQG